MKKIPKIVCLIIVILIIIYIVYMQTLYNYNFYSSLIKISIPIFAKIEEKDTHGGFHGDGEALAKAYFSDKQAQKFISEIKENKNWRNLPMNNRLQDNVINSTTSEISVPFIENGYWFFLDRHSKAINKYNYTEIFNRASTNY